MLPVREEKMQINPEELDGIVSELRHDVDALDLNEFRELKEKLKQSQLFNETFITSAKLMMATTSVIETMDRVLNTLTLGFLIGDMHGQKRNEIASLEGLLKCR